MKINVPIEKASVAQRAESRVSVDAGSNPVGGSPTVDKINSVWGEISKYGTKTTPDGRVWVIHGLTGKPIERHLAVPVSQDGKGNVIYVLKGEKIGPADQVHVSVWTNPTRITL